MWSITYDICRIRKHRGKALWLYIKRNRKEKNHDKKRIKESFKEYRKENSWASALTYFSFGIASRLRFRKGRQYKGERSRQFDYRDKECGYAAESEGYLKEELGENVEIEYIGFSNGPAANEAFLAGEIDFQNGMGDLPVLNGWRNGLDTKVIAQTGSLGANTGLVVSDKSGIDAVEELKGKNVGVYIGTSFHKSVLGILSDHGLSAGDVNLVNIDSTSDGIAALASGELDAYYVASTFYVDYAKENNIGELLEDSSNYPSYGYLIGSSKYIDEHPEVVKGLVKAFERGADFINQDKKAGAKAVSDFLKTEYDQAYSTLSNENVTVYLDDGAVENLFRAEKFLNIF